MTSQEPKGFTFCVRKSGEVEILHFGKQAVILRAVAASKFLARAEMATEQELQHVMARVTGNYKHGNERGTAKHERNR